jgi:hypothetical protein
MAVRQPVAFASTPLARFWQPAVATPGAVTRATRKPQKPDEVGRAMRELLSSAPAVHRRNLMGYIALWHKMRASCYVRLGFPGQAMYELGRAVFIAPFGGTLYLGVLRSVLHGSSSQPRIS